MPFLLILFIAMPIIEIAVLLKVGSALGIITTLAIVILTAILGTFMLRQQGLATMNRARQRLGSGEMPAEQLFEGIVLMIGGVLLLTPGFVTDAFGFACLFPVSRKWLAGKIAARSLRFVSVGGMSGASGAANPTPGSAGMEIGSGTSEGAAQSSSVESDLGENYGGQPHRPEPNSGLSDRAEDANFRKIND